LDDAKMVLDVANRVYPNAISDIARALDSASR